MVANVQGGQTTQSAIVPMQRIAPTTPGQAPEFIDLTEQSTGLDPVSGNPHLSEQTIVQMTLILWNS